MKYKRVTPLNVGDIPQQWKISYIDELTELLTNGFVGESIPHQTNRQNGVLYLQGFNIRPNRIELIKQTRVVREFHNKHRKSNLKSGDVLVVQSGHIGTAAVVPKDIIEANCHALIIVRFRQGTVYPDFFAQYINSELGQARLRGLHVGSSLPHINTGELGRFRIPIPPISEQKKLANIWRTWDTAIEKMERLLEAREKRFSWLLANVLHVPAQRNALWQHLRISDIADHVQRKTDGGDYPILTISSSSGFVLQEEKYSRFMAGKSVEDYTLLRRGEFAYNKGNSLRYQFGCIFQLQHYKEALVPHVYVCFRLREGVDSEFLSYVFHADYLKKQLGAIVNSGVRNNGLLNIRPNDFLRVTVPLPPLDKQKQIASVLNTARQEIDLLKKQAEAYRKQKRGLMQKLLTGQWRVKANEEEL